MAQPRVDEIVEALRADRRLGPQVEHALYLPAQEARYGEPAEPLPEVLRGALAGAGVERLWSHQVEGIEAVRRGEDVLVTTPTASGKSLVFHLPVLEEAVRGRTGRALFLFPLKALGQDQKGKLDALARAAGLDEATAGCEIYDGDTPRALRQRIKASPPRVVVSNPDMLHLGILGFAGQWSPFLGELRWIVLDELHTYRGVFGSHFHHVLQRLLRVCRRQGAEPVIVASSATAANAGEFAQALTGRPFRVIAESGAPREGRHFLLLRPEASAYTTTLQLLASLIERGLKTIVFTKARRITELLFSWLHQQRPDLAGRVASYRSGFLPEERRKIEGDLFAGRLDGVISTSALEMGIDVGGLDACILVGYPGSVMATWQRSGRVGRAGRESITALVPLPDALDQWLLEHPQALVERPLERLIVDPANEPVSQAHLLCAAAEIPLSRGADGPYLERHAPLVGEMLRAHQLVESADGGELYCRERRPHRGVSLRGTGGSSTILLAGKGSVIGTVDGVRVLHECHPGAIYLHAGRQFLVRELDLAASKVHVEPVGVSYFTTPMTHKETEILEVLAERRDGPLRAWLGRLLVTERVEGFERKRLQGQEVIDQHPLELPPVHFETVGLWWTAPPHVEETLLQAGEHFLGALHATEHAAIALFPLLALCDRGDIGGISYPLHPQVKSGCVFIYDGHPGGVGIARRGFEELPELLSRVLDLLGSCACEDGCPSCIQSPKCGNGNRPLDKAGAGRVLRLLLGLEEPVVPAVEGAEPVLEEAVLAGAEAVTPPMPVERRRAPAPATAAARPPERVRAPALPPPPGPEGEETPGEGVPAADAGTEFPGVDDPWYAPPRRRRARRGRDPAASPAPLRRRRRQAESRPDLAPRDTVLFDLETRRSAAEVGGWQKSYRMLVAVAVVCHLEEGRFETFGEDRVGDLVACLEAADLVVGFNSRGFDYQVLSGYTGIDYNRRLRTLDLCEEVFQRVGVHLGLNHLVQETLGLAKSADGLQSLDWVRDGRLDLVEEYCRHDVELLRDLYLFGRRMGYVCYRDREERRVKLPVDW